MSVALFPKFSNIPNLPKFSIDCAPSPPPSCPTGGSPAIPPLPLARTRSRCTLARKISFFEFRLTHFRNTDFPNFRTILLIKTAKSLIF